MKRIFRRFMNTYFSPDLDFRARLFTVLAISGVLISLVTCAESLITQMWSTALVSGVMMLLSIGIMRYARRSGNYPRCYYITVVVIFLLFFPLLFFVSGGYRSGMPAVFIFATLFTVLMLSGWQAFAMMALELVTYAGACLICFYHPEYVVQFPDEKAILADILFATCAVSIVCGIVLFLHLREYNRHRDMLRQMDEAKTTFLTTVAHEIKNPLNIISLHAQDSSELLQEAPLQLEQLEENQQIIQSTVLRIDRVLLDLMDTVSIEQGRLKLSLDTFFLGDLIQEAARPWQKQFASGRLNTRVVLDPVPSLPPIRADYARLCQVMENLLSNAFRHTKNGTVTISLQKRSGCQQICVADTGEGMSEAMREKALEGYVSADENYWRHGIGLYVCHQVVRAHGGDIWIESKPGRGTRVFFTLPQKEED